MASEMNAPPKPNSAAMTSRPLVAAAVGGQIAVDPQQAGDDRQHQPRRPGSWRGTGVCVSLRADPSAIYRRAGVLKIYRTRSNSSLECADSASAKAVPRLPAEAQVTGAAPPPISSMRSAAPQGAAPVEQAQGEADAEQRRQRQRRRTRAGAAPVAIGSRNGSSGSRAPIAKAPKENSAARPGRGRGRPGSARAPRAPACRARAPGWTISARR